MRNAKRKRTPLIYAKEQASNVVDIANSERQDMETIMRQYNTQDASVIESVIALKNVMTDKSSASPAFFRENKETIVDRVIKLMTEHDMIDLGHQNACSFLSCASKVHRIVVRQYEDHLCIKMSPTLPCITENTSHLKSNFMYEQKDVYYCENGWVHFCGDMCDPSYYITSDEECICSITSLPMSNIYEHTWENEMKKRGNTSTRMETKGDRIQMTEYQGSKRPRYSESTVLDHNGERVMIRNYLRDSITPPTHTQTASHPLRLCYDDLLHKAKNVLWYILFGPHRRQADRTEMDSVRKKVLKLQNRYIRKSKQSNCYINLQDLTYLESSYRIPTIKLPSYNKIRDLNELESKIEKYIDTIAKRIIKFNIFLMESSRYLENNQYIQFDYIVVYIAKKMCISSVKPHNNNIQVTPIPHLREFFPSYNVLAQLGYKQKNLTLVNNTIIFHTGVLEMRKHDLIENPTDEERYTSLRRHYLAETLKSSTCDDVPDSNDYGDSMIGVYCD